MSIISLASSQSRTFKALELVASNNSNSLAMSSVSRVETLADGPLGPNVIWSARITLPEFDGMNLLRLMCGVFSRGLNILVVVVSRIGDKSSPFVPNMNCGCTA